MNRTPDEAPTTGLYSHIPITDLNELLLDHSAASFLFRCGSADMLIVDRAALPGPTSVVIVEARQGYSVEPYAGQKSWGVVTYRLHRLTLYLIAFAVPILSLTK